MSTSSLQCLKLDPGLRKRIADTLVPTSKIKVRSSIQRASPRLTSGAQDILYVVLVAQGRVITLVRPKKHSIHPSDLHILVNTVHSPSIINSAAAASWLPICLPKFNAGFLHAYVTFPQRSEAEAKPEDRAQSTSASGNSTPNDEASSLPIGLGLVCISGGGGGEFETIRAWCEDVIKVRISFTAFFSCAFLPTFANPPIRT